MKHEAFISGDFDTGFIGKYFNPEEKAKLTEEEQIAAAAAALQALLGYSKTGDTTAQKSVSGENSNWVKNRKG